MIELSTASFAVACGSAFGRAGGYQASGSGAVGCAIPMSARPRLQDRQLHMVATTATNVWPSSRSGRCSG